MARDTKITVASINTCKNRQRGSIAEAAGASMAAMLIFCARSHGAFRIYRETPHMRVCLPKKKRKKRKKIPR